MIDLRSDTVTRPTPAMYAAMQNAPVGDDVWGDDPTVNAFQQRLAQETGKEAALLFPSGTQSNLVALMAHCERGDEYIVGQSAHTYRWEGGGAAVLGSIQPQPIDNAADGSLPLEKISAAVKEDDFHFARTRLLALENTIGGKVLCADYVHKATTLARQHGLAAYQLTQWAARYPHWVDAQSTGDSESGGDPAATFVTFQASEGVDHAGAGASPLVLTLAGGQRLEIRPGFCATTLERVMAALGS